MKHLLNYIILFIFIFLQYPEGNTTTYYVKLNGNDGLSGTSWTNAWQTIQKAANTMVQGDTTYISNGTYMQNIIVNGSGSAIFPITFTAYNPGTVNIYRMLGSSQNAWDLNGNNYIKIINIKITNNPNNFQNYGLGMNINSSAVTVSNVQIIGFQNGLSVSGYSHNIKKCKIIYNGGSGGCGLLENGFLSSCYFFSNIIAYNNGDGIGNNPGGYDAITGNTYDGNYIGHNNNHGFFGGSYHGPYNNYINNFFYSNASWAYWSRDCGNQSGGYTFISNNCFVGNGEGMYIENWDGYSYLIYNNYFYNNGNYAIYGQPPADLPYHAIIKNNFINKHSSIGIYTAAFANGSIFQNNIIKNCPYGIEAVYFNYTFKYNTIYSNSIAGLYINTSGNNIQSNSFYKNNYGIMNSGNNNYFAHNQIDSNTTYGLYNSGSANYIFTNYIFGPNQTYGIYDTGLNQNIINNFIFNNTQGISLIGNSSSIIESNKIYGNTVSGVSLSGAKLYTIKYNQIFRNNAYGIDDVKASNDFSTIISNNIHNNQISGICISNYNWNLQRIYISFNQICSNKNFGIYSAGTGNYICSNYIYGSNQNTGILDTAVWNNIIGNTIFNNYQGIFLTNWANPLVVYNNVFHNAIGLAGGYPHNSIIYLNSFTNNIYGIKYLVWGTSNQIYKNNLWPNYHCAFTNNSDVNQKITITNNWWGSTLASNIQKKIYGLSGYSNFTPYRLYGSFDIAQGADTFPPNNITIISIQTNKGLVLLKWNQATAPDFTRYRVYRSSIPGTTNLSFNNVITNIYNITITSDYDNPPGLGPWYYTITALDNKQIFTNESWYSKITNITLSLFTTLSISKSISNVSLNNHSTSVIPGSSIIYKIMYSNTGTVKAYNVIVFDKIISKVTFKTQGYGNTSGWTFEYSTNTAPNQSFSSSDYFIGNPTIKSNIKWIRWIKSPVNLNEKNLFLWYKLVIR